MCFGSQFWFLGKQILEFWETIVTFGQKNRVLKPIFAFEANFALWETNFGRSGTNFIQFGTNFVIFLNFFPAESNS